MLLLLEIASANAVTSSADKPDKPEVYDTPAAALVDADAADLKDTEIACVAVFVMPPSE